MTLNKIRRFDLIVHNNSSNLISIFRQSLSVNFKLILFMLLILPAMEKRKIRDKDRRSKIWKFLINDL